MGQGASPASFAPLRVWSVHADLENAGSHDEPSACESPSPVSFPVSPEREQSQTADSLQASVGTRAATKCTSDQGWKGKYRLHEEGPFLRPDPSLEKPAGAYR